MVIIEMNNKGDERATFDMTDAKAVDEAMVRFNQLVAAGKFPAAVGKDGSSRKLKEFDPTADKIIFRPQVVGG